MISVYRFTDLDIVNALKDSYVKRISLGVVKAEYGGVMNHLMFFNSKLPDSALDPVRKLGGIQMDLDLESSFKRAEEYGYFDLRKSSYAKADSKVSMNSSSKPSTNQSEDTDLFIDKLFGESRPSKFPNKFEVIKTIYLQEFSDGEEGWDTHKPREDWGEIEIGVICKYDSYDSEFDTAEYSLTDSEDNPSAEFYTKDLERLTKDQAIKLLN